jgi:hypothetical protein
VINTDRLYRTGDWVRWRPDGNLEFLGRVDSQVKLRGFRVELGEIETALRALPEVRAATAILREDLPGDKRLVAYLVAKTGDRPAPSHLRARLGELLPDHMLPNAFVWLDQLPLKPQGKVDRNALPAPHVRGSHPAGEAARPLNLLELELIRIWQQLFQREDIGRHDNFFALGGHSLLAVRLAAAIDTILGCKFPIAALFQSPTIALLALLDSAPIGAIPWAVYALAMASHLPSRCRFHLRRWWELPLRERFRYLCKCRLALVLAVHGARWSLLPSGSGRTF